MGRASSSLEILYLLNLLSLLTPGFPTWKIHCPDSVRSQAIMSEPSRATKPSALSATTSSSSSTSSVNWTVDQMNPRGKLQVAPSTGPAVIVIVILIVLTLILGVSWFGARQFRKVQRKQAAQTQKQDHDSNPETYLYRKPDLGVGALRQELAILPAIKNRFLT